MASYRARVVQRLHPTAARRGGTTRVLVVDNYDSFTWNLVQYLLELGAVVDVVANDAITVADVLARPPSHVVLSPGPGRPGESGVCLELCLCLADPEGPAIPLLGVCLGHQALCEALGARVVPAARIVHGRTSPIEHDGRGVFVGLPSPMHATRYHSLVVLEPSLPACLLPAARTPAGELMGVRHRDRPLHGVQFHPEAILSEHGHRLLDNFLSPRSWP